jgi:hypothetical protein
MVEHMDDAVDPPILAVLRRRAEAHSASSRADYLDLAAFVRRAEKSEVRAPSKPSH